MTRHEELAHLRKDKVLRRLIDHVGPMKRQRGSDLTVALLRAIVGQQLSTKAADTIWSRFLALFNGAHPEAKKIIRLPDDKLRAAGLSYQKASYLKNIARFSLDNSLDAKLLKSKTDDELVEYLAQIKGVGRWTVEMVLMFDMNRRDVFPKDDLGIQNGMRHLYGIPAIKKKELYAEMDRIAESWKPCRTLACMYLWRYKDLNQ